MQVHNIVIEPRATSQMFLVYGQFAEIDSTEKSVIIPVNFKQFHEPECKGAAYPGNEDSDYEYWTPYDGRHGDKCFLGKKMKYIRRKRERQCFNGEEKELNIHQENCMCTPLDYECDYGFTRTEDGTCDAEK